MDLKKINKNSAADLENSMANLLISAFEKFSKSDDHSPGKMIDFVNDQLEEFGLPRTFTIEQLNQILKENGKSFNEKGDIV